MARTTTRFATLIVAALCACSNRTPEIAVDTDVVDFGSVEVGAFAQRTVTLTNSGPGAAALRELQLLGGEGQFGFDGSFTAIDLPDPASMTLALTFRPAASGSQTAELTLTAGESRKSIALRGEGIARPAPGPRILVLPRAVDFGNAPPGSERRVFVSNVGDSPLRLGKMAGDAWQAAAPMLDGEDASAFELRAPAPEDGSLPPGTSIELTVRIVTSTLGSRHAALHVWSDDPAQADTEITVDANVVAAPPCSWAATPASLILPSMDGSPVTSGFVIRTLDTSEAEWCVIRNLKLAQGSASAFSLSDGPISWAAIRRGEQMTVHVRFAPSTDAIVTGAVQFDVDGAVPSTGTVRLTGVLRPDPCLMIAPTDFDFGVVGVGCSSSERDFTVYNVCLNPVTIESIDFEAASPAFMVTRRPVLPKTLGSGQQLVFRAIYSALHIGESSANLRIRTQAATTGFAHVTGQGAGRQLQTDVFAQDPVPKRDALFIIDDSPSMADKQQAIATNLGRLVDSWDLKCIDYQVAVTTTAVDAAHGGAGASASAANGRFLPLDGSRPRIVSARMTDHRQLILQNANVGTAGTTPECLFGPAMLALSLPLSTGENAGFLRPDAGLSVLIVSDSADHDTTPIADYASFLRALKPGQAYMTRVDAAVPRNAQPAAGCSYGEADASQSTRISDLAALAGGSSADVCDPNWAPLQFLDNYCPRTRFYLSSAPSDPLMLYVEINGQPYPALGPSGEVRWSYNATANAIDFKTGYVAPGGSTLTVSYPVACMP